MCRPGKHVFLALAAVIIAALAFTSASFGAQVSSSTPSVSDLATRVSVLETRVAASESSPSAAASLGGANASYALQAFDPFNWSTREFTIEAGGTVTVTNTGVLPHTFTVPLLSIDQQLDPDKSYEIKIPADAKPGTYRFYCNVPGHEQAGMVGTMTVGAVAGSQPKLATMAPTATQAVTQSIDVPPFRVAITHSTRTNSVGTRNARGVFIVVDTSVLNISKAPAAIIGADLSKVLLRDRQGRTFSLDIPGTVAASTDLLSQLQPGLTYDVALVFDVPPDASGFTLVVGGQEVPLPATPGGA